MLRNALRKGIRTSLLDAPTKARGAISLPRARLRTPPRRDVALMSAKANFKLDQACAATSAPPKRGRIWPDTPFAGAIDLRIVEEIQGKLTDPLPTVGCPDLAGYSRAIRPPFRSADKPSPSLTRSFRVSPQRQGQISPVGLAAPRRIVQSCSH